MRASSRMNPFDALGLAPDQDPDDDDVRAAWRRVAAATHPDRADGGDPAAFAAAAAAYTALRTRSGRGEALADLSERERRPRAAGAPIRLAAFAPGALVLLTRVRRGRPLVLLARLAAAAAAGCLPVAVAGWQPASYAILAGVLTWLAVTAPGDLAPPP
jgi:curved DNA-binding protein CbpA